MYGRWRIGKADEVLIVNPVHVGSGRLHQPVRLRIGLVSGHGEIEGHLGALVVAEFRRLVRSVLIPDPFDPRAFQRDLGTRAIEHRGREIERRARRRIVLPRLGFHKQARALRDGLIELGEFHLGQGIGDGGDQRTGLHQRRDHLLGMRRSVAAKSLIQNAP